MHSALCWGAHFHGEHTCKLDADAGVWCIDSEHTEVMRWAPPLLKKKGPMLFVKVSVPIEPEESMRQFRHYRTEVDNKFDWSVDGFVPFFPFLFLSSSLNEGARENGKLVQEV